MKKIPTLVCGAVLTLLVPQAALAQWTLGQEGQLVIRGGWLFDSVSDERRLNSGIVIQDGRIMEVDADLKQQDLSAANVIDLAETETILPGMIDLHAHYNLDLVDNGGAHLLVVGTDEPVYTNLLPGFVYHRELLAMTYAQIPASAVLKAATINGARALGIEARLGSIETGKLADLFVARGNPLDDIKVARDLRWVIKDGIAYDPVELLQSAEGKIGPAGPHDHADWELEIRPLRKE